MTLFKNLFGDKKWTESLTAWGLVVFLAGESAVEQICGGGVDLIPPGVCDFLGTWVSNIGIVLTALGIRRAAG